MLGRRRALTAPQLPPAWPPASRVRGRIRNEDDGPRAKAARTSGVIDMWADLDDIAQRYPDASPAQRNVYARQNYTLREVGHDDFVPLVHPRTQQWLHLVHPENTEQSEAAVLQYEARLEKAGGVLEGQRVEMVSIAADDNDKFCIQLYVGGGHLVNAMLRLRLRLGDEHPTVKFMLERGMRKFLSLKAKTPFDIRQHFQKGQNALAQLNTGAVRLYTCYGVLDDVTKKIRSRKVPGDESDDDEEDAGVENPSEPGGNPKRRRGAPKKYGKANETLYRQILDESFKGIFEEKANYTMFREARETRNFGIEDGWWAEWERYIKTKADLMSQHLRNRTVVEVSKALVTKIAQRNKEYTVLTPKVLAFAVPSIDNVPYIFHTLEDVDNIDCIFNYSTFTSSNGGTERMQYVEHFERKLDEAVQDVPMDALRSDAFDLCWYLFLEYALLENLQLSDAHWLQHVVPSLVQARDHAEEKFQPSGDGDGEVDELPAPAPPRPAPRGDNDFDFGDCTLMSLVPKWAKVTQPKKAKCPGPKEQPPPNVAASCNERKTALKIIKGYPKIVKFAVDVLAKAHQDVMQAPQAAQEDEAGSGSGADSDEDSDGGKLNRVKIEGVDGDAFHAWQMLHKRDAKLPARLQKAVAGNPPTDEDGSGHGLTIAMNLHVDFATRKAKLWTAVFNSKDSFLGLDFTQGEEGEPQAEASRIHDVVKHLATLTWHKDYNQDDVNSVVAFLDCLTSEVGDEREQAFANIKKEVPDLVKRLGGLQDAKTCRLFLQNRTLQTLGALKEAEAALSAWWRKVTGSDEKRDARILCLREALHASCSLGLKLFSHVSVLDSECADASAWVAMWDRIVSQGRAAKDGEVTTFQEMSEDAWIERSKGLHAQMMAKSKEVLVSQVACLGLNLPDSPGPRGMSKKQLCEAIVPILLDQQKKEYAVRDAEVQAAQMAIIDSITQLGEAALEPNPAPEEEVFVVVAPPRPMNDSRAQIPLNEVMVSDEIRTTHCRTSEIFDAARGFAQRVVNMENFDGCKRLREMLTTTTNKPMPASLEGGGLFAPYGSLVNGGKDEDLVMPFCCGQITLCEPSAAQSPLLRRAVHLGTLTMKFKKTDVVVEKAVILSAAKANMNPESAAFAPAWAPVYFILRFYCFISARRICVARMINDGDDDVDDYVL